MSEVMRWKLKGFIPGVEGVSKALFQPWVVPAEDFDVLQNRLLEVVSACDLAMSAVDDDERGANFVKIIQAIKDKAK